MKDTIRAKEIAKLLNISKPTVFNLAKRGEIPAYYRIGNNCYWNRKEIESYIKMLRG